MNPIDPQNPLAQLRGLHLPEPITGGLAPGWWLLLVLLLALGGWALKRYNQGRPQRRLKKAALATLDQLAEQYAQDPQALAQALNALMKRLCRHHAPQALALSGTHWVSHLDQGNPSQPFQSEPHQTFSHALFRQDPDLDTDQMLELTRQWIKNTPP